MLKYFSTNDIDTFFKVTNQLKDASKNAGETRLFYKAWSNQAIYEAAHQDYREAFGIAKEIAEYAKKDKSAYGQYTALHAEAMIQLQKQDYDAAEKAFLKAVEFRHRHFPNESAGEDLQELMKIANHRKDGPTGVKYARQILAEPNVAPIHKGRALYRLSQMAFNKNDSAEFNHIYHEMMELKHTDGIGTLRPILEVNYNIMNGHYETALHYADLLDPETSAERKAVIYYRMGETEKAYKYMQLYKRVSDSIVLVSHGNVVASCFVQMNNERLQLEQQLLENQNTRLRHRLYFTVAIAFIIILLVMIYKRHKAIKLLKVNNDQLLFENKDAAKALADLAELTFYETKEDLPLTTPIRMNELGNHLTEDTQAKCYPGVTMVFQTELPDDYEIVTDPDTFLKLLSHLLDNAARFNHHGKITLRCFTVDDKLRLSVSDTTPDPTHKFTKRFIGMFTDNSNKLHYIGMTFRISQSIVHLLQGRIWVDKEYDRGARICIELPQKPQ